MSISYVVSAHADERKRAALWLGSGLAALEIRLKTMDDV